MEFAEYGTFQSPNAHKTVKTWEQAIELRTSMTSAQRKGKNINKIVLAFIYNVIGKGGTKTSHPVFNSELVAVAEKDPNAAVELVRINAPDEYYKSCEL